MLSQNDKNFFGEKIFGDCKIAVKYFGTDDGQLNFIAGISSNISEKPERNEKPANDEESSFLHFLFEDSSDFKFYAIFVS